MAYDWQLRRAVTLLGGRRRVRCPHLRRVPEYWELCSRSAYVYCPKYLRSLLVTPPTKRAAG